MNKKEKYDAVIIGFGKGGKTLAEALGAAGKKVALVERSPKMYGGTCINVGCIPTKSLIYSAGLVKKAAGSSKEAAEGYSAAMERKEKLVSALREKNYQKLQQDPNVTVIDGNAVFLSPNEICVDTGEEQLTLSAEQFFINTGSVPFIPPIKGLLGNPYVFFSEGLLEQKELPKRLVIIGGGYIGVEFASMYAQFGSEVTILQDGEIFLPREDADIANAVRQHLGKMGVSVLTGIKIKEVLALSGFAAVKAETPEGEHSFEAEAVLVAAGRRPNTTSLGLYAAGVETDKRGGIVTDLHRRTTVPHIYAMGDAVGGLQFTYISLDDFRIVKSAVLGDGSYTLENRGAVPYSVFLDPPFSRVGMSEKEALDAGYRIKTAKLSAGMIPKARVLEQPDGLLKAVVDEETGRILGAHLFCAESHEMINLVKLAMDARLPYTALRDMIFTHPTMSEALNDLFAAFDR